MLSTLVVLSPPALTVTDGSQVAEIRGNLTTIPLTDNRFDSFSATTYANQSNGPSSSLALRLRTRTYFTSSPVGGYGTLTISINATIAAAFATNIHPGSLELRYNRTAVYPIDAMKSYVGGWNVTVNRDAGENTISGVPHNPGGTMPTYDFWLWDQFEIDAFQYYTGFYGFRASVTGFLLPPISVGIVLMVANVP